MADGQYGVPFHSYGINTPEEWGEDKMEYDDALHAFWESLDIVPSETSECLPWVHPETGEIWDCYCLYRQELARSAEAYSCDTA